VRVAKREVWSLAEAREVLERLIGTASDWSRLDEFLLAYAVQPSMVPTVLASSFAATLELAREGLIELHQQGAFKPLFLRQRKDKTEATEAAPTGAA
jgi:segregation and condensation protein A